MNPKIISPRGLSILTFSLLFAYLLSFVFEGQVLYAIAEYFQMPSTKFIFSAIIAHFVGLFSCGFFVQTPKAAKRVMLFGIGISSACTIPFFFSAYFLWEAALIVCALACGFAVASWGFFLKSCTPQTERLKTCADVLIYSNILMIIINFTAVYLSPFIGLSLSVLVLLLAGIFTTLLPVNAEQQAGGGDTPVYYDLKGPMLYLILFVVIITINSGLMYQVFNPAFAHLTRLTIWYWAVPYIVALIIMRNLPGTVKRSYFLYVGMAMIMGSFISFMLLNRSAGSYLVVDTLMLGACGIFDLFWWSIIGEMLDFSPNPVKNFGIGLSANVFGVLLGGLLGSSIRAVNISSASVTVIALTVICVTLAILPLLNRQLILLLSHHTYLMAYSHLEEEQQRNIVTSAKVLDPLTGREQEVLQLILSGKTNKAIGAELGISENTVKTHVKNIYSKYNVSSRAEIISTLLKKQTPD
jgi:DNA-binding CsgD family transcriptional regulator